MIAVGPSIVRLLGLHGILTSFQVSKLLKLPERTVRRYLTELKASGAIVVAHKGNGKVGSYVYHYSLPRKSLFPFIGATEYIGWHVTGTDPRTIHAPV